MLDSRIADRLGVRHELKALGVVHALRALLFAVDDLEHGHQLQSVPRATNPLSPFLNLSHQVEGYSCLLGKAGALPEVAEDSQSMRQDHW